MEGYCVGTIVGKKLGIHDVGKSVGEAEGARLGEIEGTKVGE